MAPRTTVLAVLTSALIASAATAQWSHNPALNTPISTGGSDQNQAKVLPVADGGCFIVWLDGIGTGWDTRLQRLDGHGIAQWPGNGVLVANTNYSSTQDYGFAVDGGGNALVAYRDDGSGVTHIKVQKIDAAGALLWGPAGVQVSVNSGGNSPRACATSDGGAVAGWTEGTVVHVQKLDSSGAPQWAAGGVTDIAAFGFGYALSDLAADGAAGAIALYVHYTRSNALGTKHLKAQRFSSAGQKLWNSGNVIAVFDGSGSLANGTFPRLVGDSAGGVVCAWYDTGGTRNAYVQHLSASGAELFPHNGVAVALDVAGRARISSDAAYEAATGDIYLVAREVTVPTQNMWRIIAQRIDSRGTRAWGNNAVELIPLGGEQPGFSQVQALPAGGAMFFWYNGPPSAVHVSATRLDSAGAPAWTPAIVEPCSANSNKARLASALASGGGRAFLAWGDSRSDANDIYAQNVNVDGSLGMSGDANGDGFVNVGDLSAVILQWGSCPAPPAFCPADLAPPPMGDGQVNVDDLVAVVLNWD